MGEKLRTLICCMDENNVLNQANTYVFKDKSYEGVHGSEGIAKMLMDSGRIDRIIMVYAVKNEASHVNQYISNSESDRSETDSGESDSSESGSNEAEHSLPNATVSSINLLDEEKFLENFRLDMEQQIKFTTDQLKNIVNGKNVNGKGEKLAQAIKAVFTDRINKAIERSVKYSEIRMSDINVPDINVTDGFNAFDVSEDMQEADVSGENIKYGSCVEFCRKNILDYCDVQGINQPEFIMIPVENSFDYMDIEVLMLKVIENLGDGDVHISVTDGFNGSLLLYGAMVRAFRENEISPKVWGSRYDIEADAKVFIEVTPYFASDMIEQSTDRQCMDEQGIVAQDMAEQNISKQNISEQNISQQNTVESVISQHNAFEEFIQYGRVQKLSEIYADEGNVHISKMLETLVKFEESILLGNPVGIKNVFDEMCILIHEFETVSDDDAMIQEFLEFCWKLGVLFDVDKNGHGDLAKLVNWSLEIGCLGQAMGLFTKFMPEYFIEKRIIYYNDYSITKQDNNSYADSVIDAKEVAKSKNNLSYFWLNEMLWKSVPKKLFLNIDSPVTDQDGEMIRQFKENFAEVKHLQETMKNIVKVDDLSPQLTQMLVMIAENTYISPVLNNLKKVCNYFFNYEVAGVAGSVQKSYKELSRMLITNKDFSERYFGEEGRHLVAYTPASYLMSKPQQDVHTSFKAWDVEEILRYYEVIKCQYSIIMSLDDSTDRMSGKALKNYLQEALMILDNNF